MRKHAAEFLSANYKHEWQPTSSNDPILSWYRAHHHPRVHLQAQLLTSESLLA